MITIGQKLTPILVEIEKSLIDHQIWGNSKPNFSEDALRAATKIFCSVLIDKMFDLQEYENIDKEYVGIMLLSPEMIRCKLYKEVKK